MKYEDIKDSECTFVTGKHLKFRSECGSHITFESVQNGKRVGYINPYNLKDETKYKCYCYERTSGSGITYETISILNL